MTSYAGKHRAPAKHKSRGRPAFLGRPAQETTSDVVAPTGGKRAARPAPVSFSSTPPAPVPPPSPSYSAPVLQPVVVRDVELNAVRADAVEVGAVTLDAVASPSTGAATTVGAPRVDVAPTTLTSTPLEPGANLAADPTSGLTADLTTGLAADAETTEGRGFRLSPAFAAVTAASIGVTGAVGAGVVLSNSHPDSTNTLVLSDLNVRGALTAKRVATLKPSSSATPRFTTRTVTATPTTTPTSTPTATETPVPATGADVLDRTAVERERAQERASRDRARLELGSPKEVAARLVAARGWSDTQFDCLVTMWTRESSWDYRATNPSSGAYGIPQALPGSKMAAYGSDWRTNPTTQIKWGLSYIESRYGTPCGAWSFWQSHNYY
ncbi:aggregation-promoting factor C-terminal-like domain-containing protein [Actinopolymorpha pittospori]